MLYKCLFSFMHAEESEMYILRNRAVWEQNCSNLFTSVVKCQDFHLVISCDSVMTEVSITSGKMANSMCSLFKRNQAPHKISADMAFCCYSDSAALYSQITSCLDPFCTVLLELIRFVFRLLRNNWLSFLVLFPEKIPSGLKPDLDMYISTWVPDLCSYKVT
jgi:hypothetical protein